MGAKNQGLPLSLRSLRQTIVAILKLSTGGTAITMECVLDTKQRRTVTVMNATGMPTTVAGNWGACCVMLYVNQMMIAAVDAAKWMICCVDEWSMADKNI